MNRTYTYASQHPQTPELKIDKNLELRCDGPEDDRQRPAPDLTAKDTGYSR
jgi:hypothetical protein